MMPDTLDNVFNDRASALAYAEKQQKRAMSFGAEYVRKLAARGFNSGKILDAGCGFGGILLNVLESFPEAEGVGIDLSEPLLELARQAAERKGLADRVLFEEADVLAIPYLENSFDVAICTNVLFYVSDPLAMINEIDRVLKPDGMLYIAGIRNNALAGLFNKDFREARGVWEIKGLFYQSAMSEKPFVSGLTWWRYEK